MSTLCSHHRTLANGVGKCSVPMWHSGLPSGFCDAPAFGEPPPSRHIWHASQQRYVREDGRYDGHVPGLACPIHGGPRLVTQKDGTAWMAALPGFTNLQECETGWGQTEEEAKVDLMKRLTHGVPRLDGKGVSPADADGSAPLVSGDSEANKEKG